MSAEAFCCFKQQKECKFVIDIVDTLQKLLVYVNPGKYGQLVMKFIAFQSRVEQKETIKLTLEGYARYIYQRAFNETWPCDPTAEQIEKINAIWDALGHPEKKLV